MLKEIKHTAGIKLARFPFHWNMERVERINVPHSLDLDNILLLGDRPIEITIVDDTETEVTGLGLGGGGFQFQRYSFELWRPRKGYFHGPKYKSEDIVRGYIVVLYKYK